MCLSKTSHDCIENTLNVKQEGLTRIVQQLNQACQTKTPHRSSITDEILLLFKANYLIGFSAT